MKTVTSLRDLRWIVPGSLGLGAVLSFIQPGQWWVGWLAFTLLTLLGLLLLTLLWRIMAGGRLLAILIMLAFALRLLTSIGLTLGLPRWGYDTPQQKAGYAYLDAYRRDAQAWDLAHSARPIWAAFDKTYSTDQYGGLLALSAGLYRYFSPDAHRPLLLVLLGALVSAVGVPFLWSAARKAWDDSIAWPAAWIFALLPESILLGGSQMREPFLMTFMAMALWGFVSWQYEPARSYWVWLALGLAGILLISPVIAVVLLIILAGWYWLNRTERSIAWQPVLGAVVILGLAWLLFLWSLTREFSFGGLELKRIFNWLGEAARWDMYLLENQSGWIEVVFTTLPAWLRMPFVAVYGALQPVLPAALIEPTLPIWRGITILRALGWYMLLPLLVYGWLSAFTLQNKRDRALWLWLGFVTWAWIVIAAVRAGGDLWDNPRYRMILLAFSSVVAARGWVRRRDGWFLRILAVEGVFLAFFTEWYLSRYLIDIPKLSFFVMLAYIGIISLLILLGGWLGEVWARRRA